MRRKANVSLPEVPVVPEYDTEDICSRRHSRGSVTGDIHIAAPQSAAFFGWRAAGSRKGLH